MYVPYVTDVLHELTSLFVTYVCSVSFRMKVLNLMYLINVTLNLNENVTCCSKDNIHMLHKYVLWANIHILIKLMHITSLHVTDVLHKLTSLCVTYVCSVSIHRYVTYVSWAYITSLYVTYVTYLYVTYITS